MAETVRSTCRFIRRQRSWFRRDPRIRWLPINPEVTQSAAKFRSAQADAAERLIAATEHR
jgi:tRNA dimethylallyltransferase